MMTTPRLVVLSMLAVVLSMLLIVADWLGWYYL